MSGEYSQVVVFAGGEGSRLRPMMDEYGFPPEYPKHLLPTGAPHDETLLGRLVQQAVDSPADQPPLVVASPKNREFIEEHPDVRSAEVVVEPARFALELLYRRLESGGPTVLGCAGDVWSDFTWDEYIDVYEGKGYPVSVLIGDIFTSDPNAAIFDVEDGRATAFARRDGLRVDGKVRKNIGVYAIRPDVEVLEIIEAHLPSDPTIPLAERDSDALFNSFVERGLVGVIAAVGYEHYNVNTPGELFNMAGQFADMAHYPEVLTHHARMATMRHADSRLSQGVGSIPDAIV